MAEVELTKEEFDAKLEEAKTAGLSSLIEGTSWKDAQSLKESALNAEKKISEKGGEVKTLQEKLAETERQKEELAAKVTTTPNDDPPKKQTPEEVIESLSEQEAKVLDQTIAKNPELKSKIAEGGAKAQAEAITALRQSMPKDVPDDFFSTLLKKSSSKTVTVDENSITAILSNAFEKNRKKTLVPSMSGTGGSIASSVDTDDAPPVRGGGGLAELAAEPKV